MTHLLSRPHATRIVWLPKSRSLGTNVNHHMQYIMLVGLVNTLDHVEPLSIRVQEPSGGNLLLGSIGLVRREIGRSLSISHNTVADVIRRAEVAGLSWPLPEELAEATLDARLYPPTAPSSVRRPEPDPEKMHGSLRAKRRGQRKASPDRPLSSRWCPGSGDFCHRSRQCRSPKCPVAQSRATE